MAEKDTPEDSKSTLRPGETNGLADGVPMQEDWREIVQRIQEETDTGKLVSLVQELIVKFDEEKLRKTAGRPGGAAA